MDLTYKYDHLGEDLTALQPPGATPIVKVLKSSAKPMIIVGSGVLERTDRDRVMNAVHSLVETGGKSFFL